MSDFTDESRCFSYLTHLPHPPTHTHPLNHPFIHPTTQTHPPTSETASQKKTGHPQNRRELVPVPARVCLASRVGVCVCVAAMCLVLREAPQMSLLTFRNVRRGGLFDIGNTGNIKRILVKCPKSQLHPSLI